MSTRLRACTVALWGSIFACNSSPPDGGVASADQQVNATAPGPSPLPRDYESMPADRKLQVLWDERILPTQYPSTLPPWPAAGLGLLGKLNGADLEVTMTRASDEMPAGRRRLVHSLGAVVQIELVPDPGQPFTGLFNGGIGLARLSLSQDPGTEQFGPGIALKLLADGVPSGNILAMLSIDGQGQNFDFFANTLSNVLPDPVGIGGKLVASIFSKASTAPGHLDVTDFSTRDRRGRQVSTPVAPEQLFFVPAASVKAVPRRSSPDTDFRVDLNAIPDGTTLYDVLASRTLGAARVHIGKILTRSPVVASRFGDETIFFKHERHAGTLPPPPPSPNDGNLSGGGGN